VIDTAMAGRPSAIDLASVGIAAAIMATVLMTLIRPTTGWWQDWLRFI
jgi:hypothetical protein